MEIHSSLYEMAGKLIRLNEGQPILKPNPDSLYNGIRWESLSTFNPAAVWDRKTERFHVLYRAVGNYRNYIGRLGHAIFEYDEQRKRVVLRSRSSQPVFSPEFLNKIGALEYLGLQGKSISIEDARIAEMLLNDERRYWLTAVVIENPCAPQVIRDGEGGGLEKLKSDWRASTLLTEIEIDNGNIVFSENPQDYSIVTPDDMSDKDVVPFPRRILGGIYFEDRRVPVGREEDHSKGEEPCTKMAKLDETTKKLGKAEVLIPVDKSSWWENVKNGAGLPPIYTKDGWLLVYHGVDSINCYRTGVSLHDLNNPRKILQRSKEPILEPEMPWEKVGDVPNVVFATGGAIVNGNLVVFYGGADKVVGAASANLEELLRV